uniref:Uncharacterized protein n=1 Tax=Myripristis murdjan TaxID=586833 RepID=A0A667Z194_9TELE
KTHIEQQHNYRKLEEDIVVNRFIVALKCQRMMVSVCVCVHPQSYSNQNCRGMTSVRTILTNNLIQPTWLAQTVGCIE